MAPRPINLHGVAVAPPTVPHLLNLPGSRLTKFVDPNVPAAPLVVNIVSMIGSGLHKPEMRKRRRSHPLYLGRQLDPFYRECRAYGRLKETDMEHLAHRCHGHIFFRPVMGMRLQSACAGDQLGRLVGKHNGKPFRALIKNLVVTSPKLRQGLQAFKHHRIWHIMNDLLDLHTIDIVHGDIKWDNYLNGKTVDLSSSITTPHVRLNQPAYQLLLAANLIANNQVRVTSDEAHRDMVAFDNMLGDWETYENMSMVIGGSSVFMRFSPGNYNSGSHYGGILRPQRGRQPQVTQQHQTFDPALLNSVTMTRVERRP
ncbi:hypothetical protein PspLS_04104 [Pyricularia sp. CBS 133598]|nr:hypothetical protein PspLS_04104 [Pyricularia sp. CBS 133598]